MPILNGYEASQRIRKICNERNWNTSIVAVSGESSDECHKRCVNCGMNDIIPKPVSMEQLMRVIQKYCNTQSP